MRVAVTGASGFIGGRIARALAASGHAVKAFGRREATQLEHYVPNYQRWDLTEGPYALGHVDAVVHCAAHVAQWGSTEQFAAVNVRGSGHVMDSVPSSTRIVYVSSGSVRHGTEARALPPYARTKLLGEQIVRQRSANTVVLRPHIVYGPGDTTLWPRVRSARRGTRLLVPGSGQNRVAVTHVDNLVHAVECALDTSSPGGVYDIADAIAPTVHELLTTMFARYDEPVSITYVPRPLAYAAAVSVEAAWTLLQRRSDPPLTRYVVQNLADAFPLDIEAAMRELHYAPRYTYLDGPL